MKFCMSGHAMDKENTYRRPNMKKEGWRAPDECRKCRSANRKLHYTIARRQKKTKLTVDAVLAPFSAAIATDFDDVPISVGVMHV